MCFQSKNFSQCTCNLQQVQHFWINYQTCFDDIMYLEHYDSPILYQWLPCNAHTLQVCYSAAAFDIHLPSRGTSVGKPKIIRSTLYSLWAYHVANGCNVPGIHGFIIKVTMGVLVQFDVKETKPDSSNHIHTQLYGLLQKYDKNNH